MYLKNLHGEQNCHCDLQSDSLRTYPYRRRHQNQKRQTVY